MSRERYTTGQVIEALTKTKGMVYLAARSLGCAAQTVYNYIERHPTIKEAWEQENGVMLDTAELKLFNAIMRDDIQAIKYYLSTKGRSRGYVERQEHVVYTPEQLQAMSDDELRGLIEN